MSGPAGRAGGVAPVSRVGRRPRRLRVRRGVRVRAGGDLGPGDGRAGAVHAAVLFAREVRLHDDGRLHAHRLLPAAVPVARVRNM